MMGEHPWRVLDFNEGELVTVGGGAVEVTSFRGPLSTRDGEARFALRLWRATTHPDEIPEADRADARENCLLAVGPAGGMAVELRVNATRYRVGHRDAQDSSVRTIRHNLGHEVTVQDGELFDADEAGELFLSYYRTGTVSTDEYSLRELNFCTAPANPTHVLTVDFDRQRLVLPAVEAGEFAAFLSVDDEPSVLVLWPLPPGKSLADLTDEERSTHQEFLQTAGSAGRYTVEIRQDGTLYTLGHVVDYLVWGTEPTEISAGSRNIPVYPNEVFTPAEVGTIFKMYTETGRIPEDGYLRRETL